MFGDGEAVACSGLDLCRLWRLHCVSVVAASVCTALLLDVAIRKSPNPLSPNPNPKSPNPLSQPLRNPKGVLAPTHHDVPPYVHGPVPRGPPNPKSPNPLSQPPRNPKGVLVPKHHDVPPTHHFFLFFKGCTATSDGILASHLWLLQVTEFLVSQVTCLPLGTGAKSHGRWRSEQIGVNWRIEKGSFEYCHCFVAGWKNKTCVML